ncbi:helix-turn-helix domain-containing protein (plasmid) [Nocardia sp. CA-151230]|uniref:helix-turn-helix domain-containing protein n=1 Tax=Nocardia sp. CA-151230 TaxID=3239982 RepID=UPI003D93E660
MDTNADLEGVDNEVREELARLDAALGRKLRRLRRGADMSQQELADASGVGKRTLVRFEQGERPMNTRQLQIFCRILGVTPGQFVTEAEAEIGIE